jgi:predicted AAA+ superfamily ATPase
VVDEIQRAPELILPIKAAIDRYRRPGRFVLTGSSDLLRLQRTPDSLAGRAVTLNLRGFSQGELRRRPDDFVTWFGSAQTRDFNPWTVESSTARSEYVDLLAAGSYPEPARAPQEFRRAWIDSYLRQVVQRDSADIRRVVDPGRLLVLLRLIAANQAGELVKARLAQAASIPATTITDYMGSSDLRV